MKDEREKQISSSFILHPSSLFLHPCSVVSVIVLLATLPFLHKAFHIDDVLYLTVAEQILDQPFDPYGGMVLWDAEDGLPAPIFDIDYNPPLWKYLLAFASWLFGKEEWKLHLLESFFVWLAGLGLFRLGTRFVRFPIWAVAMILLGPFFLPAQNIMMEGPLLCMWIWTLEFYILARETGRLRWAVLAGLVLAGAVMTKYTACLILALLFITSIRHKRLSDLVALAPPLVVLAGWSLFCWWRYGTSHLGAHGFFFEIPDWPVRTLTVLRCVGAVTVFGPAIGSMLLRRGKQGWIALGCCMMIALVLAWLDLRQASSYSFAQDGMAPTVLQRWHFLLFTFHGSFCCLGLSCVVFLRWRSRERSDKLFFLELWILLAFAFNIACVPFVAVRHLIWFLVPMTWLVADEMAQWTDSGIWRRNLLIGSTLLAAILASADYQIAGVYRDVAETTVRKYVAVQGRNTWFTGDWGLLHYATRAGAHPLIEEPEKLANIPPMQPGDYVIRPLNIEWKGARIPSGFSFGPKPIEHLQPTTSNPFRTLAPLVNYYSVRRDFLPWEILVRSPRSGSAFFELPPLDDILVYEVQANSKDEG